MRQPPLSNPVISPIKVFSGGTALLFGGEKETKQMLIIDLHCYNVQGGQEAEDVATPPL